MVLVRISESICWSLTINSSQVEHVSFYLFLKKIYDIVLSLVILDLASSSKVYTIFKVI